MNEESKNSVQKRFNNLAYSLNEILDLFHRHQSVTPDIREEIQDAVEEWGKILDSFKGHEVTESQREMFAPHIDAVTYYMYQMYDCFKKGWVSNVTKSLSALERFKLVFRTGQNLVQAEKTSVWSSTAMGVRVPQVPIPPEFLRFGVFRDNPSAFSYYTKLADIGDGASRQQLADELGVTPNNITMVMKKLENAGFIESDRDRGSKEKVYRIKRMVEAL